MRFYPAGESICRELLELPQQNIEWIITDATVDEIVAAGFQRPQEDGTCFIHPESGDLYRFARRQYLDELSGQLCYQAGDGVTLEDELATRALTILAMARDGDDVIDPFDGREDLAEGVLRNVTPHFGRVPVNLLIAAVWAARLSGWGFSIAHSTHALMKRMVANGAVDKIPQRELADAVLQAMASPRPSVFFRVLHRCGALRFISEALDDLFAERAQANGNKKHLTDYSNLDAMRTIDQTAAETDNVLSVIRRFHEVLGDKAEQIFSSLGLSTLFDGPGHNNDC
jgi:tRNA nucleotidyltransferase (CCA-adding enzyme)